MSDEGKPRKIAASAVPVDDEVRTFLEEHGFDVIVSNLVPPGQLFLVNTEPLLKHMGVLPETPMEKAQRQFKEMVRIVEDGRYPHVSFRIEGEA